MGFRIDFAEHKFYYSKTCSATPIHLMRFRAIDLQFVDLQFVGARVSWALEFVRFRTANFSSRIPRGKVPRSHNGPASSRLGTILALPSILKTNQPTKLLLVESMEPEHV